MKRSSVGVFFFFPLLLLPRVMVVLQFYRDYEVFFVVVVVGGGVGGGVLHSTWTVSVQRTFFVIVSTRDLRVKKFLTSFRFYIFLGGVCLFVCVEIKMKTLIFVFFCRKWMCRSLCLSFINRQKE